jgi:hypothetical protein
MKCMMSFVGLLCCCLIVSAQVTVSPAVVHFDTVVQGVPDSVLITFTNNTQRILNVQDVEFYHSDAFSVKDSAFSVNANGGSHGVWVYCNPRHNVDHSDWLLVKSSSHHEVPHAYFEAVGKYPEAYYASTQNLYNHDLFTALHNLVSTGTASLTYNNARDAMYMNIDNQRLNGQGATVNTIECAYTGYLAVGYTSRTDAQNNYGLNTEHTMPQSFFSSTLPELSDLHHLFVVTATSNTERGNNPFGTVANPSWQQGGSLSNGNLFEPRDSQKGPSARALLYFKTRYQDYQGFICGMEATLRQWNNDFAPTLVQKNRNDEIAILQHNRNPYVDHPEFMDRMKDFCSSPSDDSAAVVWWVTDTLDFGELLLGDSLDGYLAFSNQGNELLTMGNLGTNDSDFTLLGSGNYSIASDSIVVMPIRYRPRQATGITSTTMSFMTNDLNNNVVAVTLIGKSVLSGGEEAAQNLPIQVWPNPVQDKVNLKMPKGWSGTAQIQIFDLTGRRVSEMKFPIGRQQVEIDVANLPQGPYVLSVISGRGGATTQLITVAR